MGSVRRDQTMDLPAQASRYAKACLAALDRLAAYGVIGLVHVYRYTVGRVVGGCCRFIPSCSQYCIEAVRRYGAARGTWKTMLRLLRCHPFHPGGYDPP